MLAGIARSSDRGQLLPIFALSLTLVMGAAALAVDVGYWRYEQRLEQTAADSAAIAGAGELNFPTANDVVAAARADATTNGYTDGANNATVTVNNPPASGPYAGNASAVEAIVTQQQPVFFIGVFGSTQSVRARAVALVSSAHNGCIYVLKGSISGNLTSNGLGGGGITTRPLCGLLVNGNMTVTGNANVDVSYAGYAGNGPKGGTYPDGQPVSMVPAADPCMRLAGCAYLATLKTTNPGLFSATCQDAGGMLPASPLPPGHYCYGPYGNNVTLQSGLFIMDNGMFAGQVAGNGVTIYNNCTVSCDLTLNGGNTNDSIIAPMTGNTAGMVYYQSPTLQNNITVNGAAGNVSAIGGVYAPSGSFTFNGQLPTISLLVAGQIRMNGGGLNAGGIGGFPVPGNAVLVE
jgi:hypothetical protein